MTRFLLITLIAGCSAADTGPRSTAQAPLSSPFTLAYGERKEVAGTDLTVGFVRLAGDSRCPASVTCVWEGDGEIEIEMSAHGRASLISLHTRGTGEYASERSAGGYRIRLIELAPAPANPPRPATDYIATLVVEREKSGPAE